MQIFDCQNFSSACYPCGKSAGFTLIEILVVLVIVSIMTGVVVVNMPTFVTDGDLDEEADRLKVLIEMSRQESLMQAVELGFEPERDSYRFLEYDDLGQQWYPVDRSPFKTRKLPASLRLELNVEGNDWELENGGESTPPPVLILSSGEMTPFELYVRDESGRHRVLISDGYGELTWESDEEPN